MSPTSSGERERERERPENVLVFGPAGWFQNCFACCAADAMANGCQSILRVNRPATATTSRHDRVASSTSPVSRPLVLSAQAPPPKKRETQEKRKYPTTNFPGNVVLCTILTRSRSPNRESMIDLLCRLQSTQWKNELKNWGENWGASEGPVRGRGNIEVVGRPTKRRTAAALNLELWEGYARGRQGVIHHGEKCGASVSENPADERGELVAHRAA